jgi:hypothetical protein
MGAVAKRSVARRLQFCRVIASGGSVRTACRVIDMARQAVYAWRDADPIFAKMWDEAYEDHTDLYEEVISKAAARGSLYAALAALRARRPGVWAKSASSTEGDVVEALAIAHASSNAEAPKVFLMPTDAVSDNEPDEPLTIEGEQAA